MTSMEIVHQGWLTKSPPSRGIFRPRWRRRWFVLRTGSFPNQFVLEYFTDESAKRHKGLINLDECEQLIGPLSVQERHKFTFQIRTPNRIYYLASDSEAEMTKWVASLCQVCCLKTTDDENQGTGTGTVVYSRGGDENQPATNSSISSNNNQEEQETTATDSDGSSPTLSNKILSISSVSGPYMPISECITGKPIPKSELNDVTYCNTSVFQFPPEVNWATHPYPGIGKPKRERDHLNKKVVEVDGEILQTCVVAPPRPPKSKGSTSGVLVTVTPSQPQPPSTSTSTHTQHGESPYDNEENPEADSSSTCSCSSLHSPPPSAGVIYSNISDIITETSSITSSIQSQSSVRSGGVRGTLLGQPPHYSNSNPNSPTSPFPPHPQNVSASGVPPPVVDRNLKPLRGSSRCITTNTHGDSSSQKVTASYTSGTMTLPSPSRSASASTYSGPAVDRSRKPPDPDGHGHLSLGPTPAQIQMNSLHRQPNQSQSFTFHQHSNSLSGGFPVFPSTSSSSPRSGPIVSPSPHAHDKHSHSHHHHEYEEAESELKGTYLQIDCHTSKKDADSPTSKFSGSMSMSKNTLGMGRKVGLGGQQQAADVEYRMIDPIKTRALNKTREDREKQLAGHKNINN